MSKLVRVSTYRRGEEMDVDWVRDDVVEVYYQCFDKLGHAKPEYFGLISAKDLGWLIEW